MSNLASKEIVLDFKGNLRKNMQEKWFDLKNSERDYLGYIASEGLGINQISIFEEGAKPILSVSGDKLLQYVDGKSVQLGTWKWEGKLFKAKSLVLKDNGKKTVLFGENANLGFSKNIDRKIEVKDESKKIIANLYFQRIKESGFQRINYKMTVQDSSFNSLWTLGFFLSLFYSHWSRFLITGGDL